MGKKIFTILREREGGRERGNVQLYNVVHLEICNLRDTFVGVFEI